MLLSSAVYSNRRRAGLAGLARGADVIVITWLHRLLAAFVLAAATEEGAAREAQAAVEETVASEAARLNNAGIPGPLLAWQGHLRHVAVVAGEREDEMAGLLLNELGSHLHMIAEYEAARPYLEQALAIFGKALGPEHPNTKIVRENLESLGAW